MLCFLPLFESQTKARIQNNLFELAREMKVKFWSNLSDKEKGWPVDACGITTEMLEAVS